MRETSRVFGRLGRIAVTAAAAALTLAGCHRCPVDPNALAVDPTGNGVFEPGETVSVEPSWYFRSVLGGPCSRTNLCAESARLALAVSDFSGPAGAVYTVVNDIADYGAIPRGTIRSCAVSGNCYRLSVEMPSGRPVPHWDATLVEDNFGSTLLDWLHPMGAAPLEPLTCPTTYDVPGTWTLHMGASFSDVSTASAFYPYIENLFHHGITGGCGAGVFCPGASIRRDQMAVLLLKAAHGSAYTPPPCIGRFADVACPGPFTNWVEQIYMEGIVAQCVPGSFPMTFCPAEVVTRQDMAVWLLKVKQGIAYFPPPAVGLFADVPLDDPVAPWVEELYNRHITAGCNASPLLYCPGKPNRREQMAVFIDKTFGLRLY